jgi:hypothetical protein
MSRSPPRSFYGMRTKKARGVEAAGLGAVSVLLAPGPPADQALKLDPQPQVLVALGLLNTNPRPMISSLKSIVVPFR